MVDEGLFAAGEVGDADGGGDDEIPDMERCWAVSVSLLTAREDERIWDELMLIIDDEHGEVGGENDEVSNGSDEADEAIAVDEAAISVTSVEDEDEEMIAVVELARELYDAFEVNDAVPDVGKAELVTSAPVETEEEDVEALGPTAEDEVDDEKVTLNGIAGEMREEDEPALDKIAKGEEVGVAGADDDRAMMLVKKEDDVAGELDMEIGEVDAEAPAATVEEELASVSALSDVIGEMLGDNELVLDEVAKGDNARVADGLDVAHDDEAITLVWKKGVVEGALVVRIVGDDVEALSASADESLAPSEVMGETVEKDGRVLDEGSETEDAKDSEVLDAVDADDDDDGKNDTLLVKVSDVAGALAESGDDDVSYKVEEEATDEDGRELDALDVDEDHSEDELTLLEKVVESTGVLEDSGDEEATSEVAAKEDEREDDVDASVGNKDDDVLEEVTVDELKVEPLASRSPVEL